MIKPNRGIHLETNKDRYTAGKMNGFDKGKFFSVQGILPNASFV